MTAIAVINKTGSVATSLTKRRNNEKRQSARGKFRASTVTKHGVAREAEGEKSDGEENGEETRGT